MADERSKRTLAITLIVLGVLFLLVSNHIVLGWEHVWPMFLVFGGLLLLRLFRGRRTPELLFGGMTSVLLGVFLLLFTVGAFSWQQMETLWPAIPLVAGAGLLAVSTVSREGGFMVILGSATVLFAAVSFLITSGVVESRVTEPFMRFWPLALVLAGVVILKTHPRRKVDPDLEAVRSVLDDDPTTPRRVEPIPPALEGTLLERVRSASSPEEAVGELVHGLKANCEKFSWVGVYRLSGDVLTLSNDEYVGPTPQHRRILLSEGVCGAAASERATIVVPDVCQDPRYLACSPTVNSEIVVPIMEGSELIGVLDIDSDDFDAFTPADRRFLESLVARVAPYLRVEAPSRES
jgi:GAF domain-containing protein